MSLTCHDVTLHPKDKQPAPTATVPKAIIILEFRCRRRLVSSYRRVGGERNSMPSSVIHTASLIFSPVQPVISSICLLFCLPTDHLTQTSSNVLLQTTVFSHNMPIVHVNVRLWSQKNRSACCSSMAVPLPLHLHIFH